MRAFIVAREIAFARIKNENIPHSHWKNLAAAGGHLRNGAELLPISHFDQDDILRELSLFYGSGSSTNPPKCIDDIWRTRLAPAPRSYPYQGYGRKDRMRVSYRAGRYRA